MSDIKFRLMRYRDILQVQQLVDDLFNTYPAEYGLRPSISRTFAEFSRFP